MKVGKFVTYVAPHDVGIPEAERREYPAIVTEVCSHDPNAVGLFIFWPRFGENPYRPLDGDRVVFDGTAPYEGDTWHHVDESVEPYPPA